MPYLNGQSVDAAQQNQHGQTNNGVLDYRPHEHGVGEGPLGVQTSGSSTSIEFSVNGGTVLIDGRRVSVTPTSVSIEAGFPEGPRADIIYAADDGSVNVLTGSAGETNVPVITTDVNGDPTLSTTTPAVHQNPLVEPQSAASVKGCIIAAIAVYPGDTDSTVIGADDIQDRRQPAPDVGSPFPSQPAIVSPAESFPDGTHRIWPLHVRPGQTCQLWSYFLYHNRYGIFEMGSGTFDRRIIKFGTGDIRGPDDYQSGEDMWDLGNIDNATLWQETGEPLWGGNRSSPMFEFDHPPNSPSSGYAFYVANETGQDFPMPRRGIGLQVRMNIHETGQL